MQTPVRGVGIPRPARLTIAVTTHPAVVLRDPSGDLCDWWQFGGVMLPESEWRMEGRSGFLMIEYPDDGEALIRGRIFPL